MSERKTYRKKRLCGIIGILGICCLPSQHANNSGEKFFLMLTSSVLLAFGLALREIRLHSTCKKMSYNAVLKYENHFTDTTVTVTIALIGGIPCVKAPSASSSSSTSLWPLLAGA